MTRILGHLWVALALVAAASFGDEPEEKSVSPYEIPLRSRQFTPEPGIPADLGDRINKVIEQEAGKEYAHILLQFDKPPDPSDRQSLDKQGVQLLEPLTKYTWYAKVSAKSAQLLPKTEGVRWADFVRGEDKLAERLQQDYKPLPYERRGDDRVAVSVLFHKGVTSDEVTALARRVEAKLEDFNAKSFPVVRSTIFNVTPEQLKPLSESDIVSWIEPSPPPDVIDNQANGQPFSNVDHVQAAPFNLNGIGITVGVWEATEPGGGFTIRATHLDLTPRVTIEEGATTSSHATHVAGTIGSTGTNAANTEGMAPNVNLTSWSSGNDVNEMTNAATSAGGAGDPTPIQISNHSYGAIIGWNDAGNAFTNNQNLFGQYTNQSQSFDNVVVQTGLIVVKAAGNNRNDTWDGTTVIPGVTGPGLMAPPGDGQQGGGVESDSIDPRGTAKNVILVGAMNGATDAITAFSDYGPTDDGRIKPDLVAHGRFTVSLDDDTDSDSTTKSGTSMAAPVVAGIAALVLQQANAMNINVTPAAMKALLVQTARDVDGTGQATPGPDYTSGWGVADAEGAINLLRQGGLTQGNLTGTGLADAWTRTFFVPPGQAEIRMTLVWDDPAGNPAAAQNLSKLVNDLDLRLIAPNTNVFTPWTLDPTNPTQPAVRNGGNDATNNVEQVSVLNPESGTWTIRVSADAGNLPQSPRRSP